MCDHDPRAAPGPFDAILSLASNDPDTPLVTVQLTGNGVAPAAIDVDPAGLDETLELSTFCGGTGRSWAERRTSIAGDRGASIEAVSLWIRVDPTTGRPVGLGDDFVSAYGEAARGLLDAFSRGLRKHQTEPKPDA